MLLAPVKIKESTYTRRRHVACVPWVAAWHHMRRVRRTIAQTVHQRSTKASPRPGRPPAGIRCWQVLLSLSLKSQSPSARARAAQPAHTTYRRCRAARSRSRGGQHERGGTNASGVPSVPALIATPGAGAAGRGGAGRNRAEQSRGRERERERGATARPPPSCARAQNRSGRGRADGPPSSGGPPRQLPALSEQPGAAGSPCYSNSRSRPSSLHVRLDRGIIPGRVCSTYVQKRPGLVAISCRPSPAVRPANTNK
jgi:hypothetical protein